MTDLRVGAALDPASRERTPDATTISSADLTTHGVIVGMTGSGKTGLGVVLIEECLSAGIPALLIDPKGDLTNLCLTFPALASSDFEPWVNQSDVAKSGVSAAEFAAQQATTWKEGLAGWDIGPDRLAGLRHEVEFAVYTPGSSAGRQVNIVGSLQAPAAGTSTEDSADEIESYVSSLLAMVGINADPLSSREHVLLSALIQNAWSQGRDLDLPTLLMQVQQPPIRKLGILELDQFFPPGDRAAFTVRLNALLASPGFATWLAGDPVDVQAMLHTADGRPRCAIITTSHLSDEQRQSVTTLILSKFVTWMRRQGGASDLRALVYMDEVAGYLPPTANPPTKKPIMLLLKQARAFGVGVVLSTQNPVDVDYKALSNAGTWLIGRLQTEQDKARLIDGLKAASGGVDIGAVGDLISSLGKRQFVLKRAAADQPSLMTTRWAMSYLRGPLMREEITRLATFGLVAPVAAEAPEASAQSVSASDAATAPPSAVAGGPGAAASDETLIAPAIAAGIPVSYLAASAPWATSVGAGSGPRHEAGVVARVRLRFDDTKLDLTHDDEYEAVLFPLSTTPDPAEFVPVDYDDRDLVPAAAAAVRYALPDADISRKAWWTALQKGLIDALVRTRTTEVLANADLKLYGRVGESPDAFAARCTAEADAKADAATAALQRKYEAKLRSLHTRADAASGNAARTEQLHDDQYNTATQITSILGGVFGGSRSRRSILTEARRENASAARVEAARDKAVTLQQSINDVESELADEMAAIDADWKAKAATVTTVTVPLERSDVSVADLRLVWIPVG